MAVETGLVTGEAYVNLEGRRVVAEKARSWEMGGEGLTKGGDGKGGERGW